MSTRTLDRTGRGVRPALDGFRTTPVTVLDIGTTKISCFIARPRPSQGFALLGRGYQAAEGFKGGEVIDVDAAEASLAAALHEAEEQAGDPVREVVIVTNAGRPVSRQVRVTHELGGATVRDEQLRALLVEARAAVADETREVLHTVPVAVGLDGGRPLKDPRGARGERLEMLATVVCAGRRPIRDLVACLERCHVRVTEIVAAPYAAGIACLTEDEMERGCLVLDLGGGITGFAHFADGRLLCLDQVPYGGIHVTNDLAYGLSTGRAYAERLKTLHGGVVRRACDADARITFPLLGERPEAPTGEVARARITHIVRARVEEILDFVQDKIRANWEVFERRPPRSVVLTGGASQLDGLEELAEEIFGIPARRGRPDLVHGRHGTETEPCCAATCGALSLASGDDDGLSWGDGREMPVLAGWLARLARWVEQNF